MTASDTNKIDEQRQCQAATSKGFRCKKDATSYRVYEGDGLEYLSCDIHLQMFTPHRSQSGAKPPEEEAQINSEPVQHTSTGGDHQMREEHRHIDTIEDQGEIEILEGNIEMQENSKAIENLESAKIKRDLAINQAKKYLDGQEYNLERITAEVKTQLLAIAQGYIEVGRRLLAVKQVEGHGHFLKWLDGNFQFSRRTAYNFMHVAEQIERRPELQSLAKGGVSKALILLDMPEEYQDEYVENGTIDGKPLDQYHTMTRDELKAEIKKLKKNQEKIIEEETKALRSENDALVNENRQLKKYKPAEDTTPEWCFDQINEIDSAVFLIETKVNLLLDDERLKDDIILQAKIDKPLRQVQATLNKLVRSWYDYSDME